MRKKIISSLFLICLILNSSYLYAKKITNTAKEDSEINNLKNQIKLLEIKIKQLEEIKQKKEQLNKKNIKIGLALSGGGAKGLAHIGVLKVLESYNIRPDFITGTSMGAIVAALYSAGYTPDEIEQFLTKADWESFVNGTFATETIPLEKKINDKKYMASVRYDNKFNFSLPQGFRNTQIIYFELKKALSNVEGITDFDKLPIPLRIVATDLNTGKAVAFRDGDLAKAICASIAIPTVFDPVNIDNNLYVDGLISRNFPVIDAIEMGANVVIGSDVGNELKDKKDYNIISVLNQLVAIQSSSSTKEQQNLATVLITPDILDYSATDLDKAKKFIELGEKATLKKADMLEELANNITPKKPVKYKENQNIVINNIKYLHKVPPKDREFINSVLDNIKGKTVSLHDIEQSIIKVYGNDIINTIYYQVEGDTLIVDAHINPNNSVGMGVNYLTGYGTTFNLGTRISNLGAIGNTSFLNVKLGDYNGVTFKNFIYYGYSNKIGLFANISHNQSPLFLYKENKKISDSTITTSLLEMGILSQYNNQFIVSYGINSMYVDLKQNTGSIPEEKINYAKNYNGAFLKLSFDSLQELNNHPNRGIKGMFEYSWEGSFNRSRSNFHGPAYILDGYHPLSKKFTFKYGLSGGFINGHHQTSEDRFLRIGGTKSNFKEKEFAFYGLSYQQRLVKKFAIGRIGVDYEILPNLYVGANWNIGTFNTIDDVHRAPEDLFFRRYLQGGAASFTYESILGPVEFSVSKTNKHSKFLSQISFGYIFQ